jgi:hypothetical protein
MSATAADPKAVYGPSSRPANRGVDIGDRTFAIGDGKLRGRGVKGCAARA